MRLMKWLFLCALLLLTVGVVAAQDEITLTPFTDETFGIQGVIPEGWTEIGLGAYIREPGANSATTLVQQAANATVEQVASSFLPAIGLEKLPDSVANLEANGLSWELYSIE